MTISSDSLNPFQMEPLSVGVHSVRTIGKVKPGQTVAVYGAGPVGLLCLAVAKALGAKRTIVIDIDEPRMKFAKEYAATDSFLPPPRNPDEKPIDYSRRSAAEMQKQLGLTERGPNAVDLVIDATGAPPCIQSGVFLVKPGGTYVQVRLLDRPILSSSSNILLTRSAWALQRSLFPSQSCS